MNSESEEGGEELIEELNSRKHILTSIGVK